MLNRIQKCLLASVIGIGVWASSGQAAMSATGYSGLVVFGDSLSDSGNNSMVFGNDPAQIINSNSYIAEQPYSFGTYSNGPVWATQFASALGLALAPSRAQGGTNHAHGGAVTGIDQTYAIPGGTVTLPSLASQASDYLSTSPGISASTLFVVAGGGNDARGILQEAFANTLNNVDPEAQIQVRVGEYVSNVTGIVGALQAAGAQHIIVWNAPDIGLVPAVMATGSTGSFLGSSIASSMKDALALQFASVSGVHIFDLFGLITRAADSGSFSNMADACGNPALGCSLDLGAAFFYDGIHPTTAAHAFIANEMQVLAAVPEPTEVAMLLVGLIVVAGLARRKTASI